MEKPIKPNGEQIQPVDINKFLTLLEGKGVSKDLIQRFLSLDERAQNAGVRVLSKQLELAGSDSPDELVEAFLAENK